MAQLSAPLFSFGNGQSLPAIDAHLLKSLTTGSFVMTGPGVTAEAGHLPVRGDLAHIALAGRYFVPHYAVPMPHVVTVTAAALRKTGQDDADALCELARGEVFDVLDITGSWAWGQAGDGGFVGYVLVAELEAKGE